MKKKDREEIDSAIAGFFVSSRNRYAAAWPSNNTTIYMDLEEVFSVSLRIRYLEFYLPLYSMDLLTPPSLSFCPLFSLTPYSFLLSFPRTGRALRRPLTRTTRIALPGISEVLSRIQRLHRPSWMDRQSSLTLRLSAPPLSLSLPPYTYPLARLLSLLSLSLSLRRRRRRRLFSRPFFFLRVYPTTRCEIIYCGWILAKNSRVSMPRNTRIPNIPNFFPLPPRFVFLLARYDARGYGR